MEPDFDRVRRRQPRDSNLFLENTEVRNIFNAISLASKAQDKHLYFRQLTF